MIYYFPPTLSILNLLHSQLSLQQVLVAYLMVWPKPLSLSVLSSWNVRVFQTLFVAWVHSSLTLGENKRHPVVHLGSTHIPPPCLHCRSAALLPLANQDQLPLPVKVVTCLLVYRINPSAFAEACSLMGTCFGPWKEHSPFRGHNSNPKESNTERMGRTKYKGPQ